jgi:penicillin-binding protein 2
VFERRLKVFLGVLLFFTAVLVLRAAHVQVIQHAEWDRRAADTMKKTDRQETTRGEIRDYWRRKVAVDEPCVDAVVDYRALTREPDAKWVNELARVRLRDRLGPDYAAAPRDRRRALFDAEVKQIREDIEQMWPRLAKVSGVAPEEIEETRRQIVEKVKLRRRYVWYHNYERALNEHRDDAAAAQTQPASVWKKWLLDDEEDAPDVDNFQLTVSEESAPHVVLRSVDGQVRAELTAYSERFPGLSLRFSAHRVYPYGDAAAHVIGRLSKVRRTDIDADPNLRDELRNYEPNDLIGRGGVEQMCEQLLRGVRGRTEIVDGRIARTQEAVPGKDVQLSIDIELQSEIQALFKAVPVKYSTDADREPPPDVVAMHGAAVVIDVASGEVLALVSAPSFDLNTYDEQYAALTSPENLHDHLLNRATQAQREPGSTVKPMVGLAGAASNVRRPDEPFECTGYMVVNGHAYPQGRCWVNSMFHDVLCPFGPACTRRPCPAVAHHVVPSSAPHPTGMLTLPDAIERSCNPYFESIAHALGPASLSDWYRKFGLGRKTYIGIAEARGLVPASDEMPVGAANTMFSTWTAGIGQGPVQATPIQMANVAATLARGGVWVRPRLLRADSAAALGPLTNEPGRVDLGLPPAALAAVKEGMIRVVNSNAGSGGNARRDDMVVAGKTGSATAAPAWMKVIDPVTKREVRDERGRVKRVPLVPSTHSNPNPLALWYRDTGREGAPKPTLTHSWFMGYAPADNPQVAFAVLVEYGGGGGAAAGSVAKELLKLCVTHRHLKLPGADKTPVAAATNDAAELLHDARR